MTKDRNPGSSRRIVLVTGGAGHLGRHVVRRFLRDGADVHVPVLGPEEADALASFLDGESGPVRVHTPGDLSSGDAAERLVSAVRAEAGDGPGVLLNLAGGFAMDPIEATDPATWDRMWRMNASTAFLCARAVIPGMKAAGWGRIVNVSALPALDRGKAGLSAYAAAKAAVLNLTGTLAKEGARHGITANAVLPSIIDTPANREAMPEQDTSTWIAPDAIAEVIAFLASERVGIVNGAAIPLTLE